MYLKLKKRKRRKMIHLNNSTSTEFAVTLYEKTTLTNPFYLFHFKNDTSFNDYYCIITDTSTQKQRFNLFSFTEGVNDALNGSLILGKSGYYEYYIYEQTNATNLDPTLSTGLVEQGKMRLFNVADNPNYSSHTIAGVTNYVYNPS
jgi:hypothetical protein